MDGRVEPVGEHQVHNKYGPTEGVEKNKKKVFLPGMGMLLGLLTVSSRFRSNPHSTLAPEFLSHLDL
jgi:hypothetical protein